MINITERAKKELKKLLSKNVDWPQACLRIMNRGQGIIGLGIDIEAPGDRVVEYEGMKLLVIEPELANNLQGVTIDIDETPEGSELVILS